MNATQAAELLGQLDGWAIDNNQLTKKFRFKNFTETMRFVNAVASLAEREDHHPDMEVGYGRATIRYSTHDVGGLSRNDFVCAALVDSLAPV